MKPLRLLLLGLLLPGFVSGASSPPSVVGTPIRVGYTSRSLNPASSLDSARRAQALLGPGIWSSVIRVQNTAERSPYPATVYALVFEEAGILWFYTDADGTQSLTLHPDRLAEEKADFGPLLREIDPGFSEYDVLPSDVARVSPPVMGAEVFNHGSPAFAKASAGRGDPGAVDPLPNGSFVESLAALTERVRSGERIERARLLNCYVDTPAGRRGHTVLTYETPRGLFLLDPGRSPEPRSMPRAWADDAMALAGAALQGSRVARARWVPTVVPLPGAAIVSLEIPNDPMPGEASRLMR